MRRLSFFPLLFALLSCTDDNLTGQPGEPDGPLQITHLTLLDNVSRDHAIFTDTVAPADCSDPAVRDSPACFNEPYGDKYGVKKSRPTPDSGRIARVVFNKVPFKLKGQDLEMLDPKTLMADPNGMVPKEAIDLLCDGPCTGVPPLVRTLIVTGFSRSPIPTDPRLGLGPALQMGTDSSNDPLVALEPETAYHAIVGPDLSGRDGNVIGPAGLLQADPLLHFTTEPLRILQAGLGDPANDPFIYGGSPYTFGPLSDDGVLVLLLNTGVDDAWFAAATFTATVGNQPASIQVTLMQPSVDPQTMAVTCAPGNQRSIYVYPTKGTWGAVDKGQLTLTLKGADIHDVSQAAGHPKKGGTHTLKTDMTFTTTLSKDPADPQSYTGLVATPAGSCPVRPASAPKG